MRPFLPSGFRLRPHLGPALVVGLAALAYPSQAQLAPETQWTLGDLIERVLNGAPSVMAAQEREVSAKASYDRSWMEFLPDFKIGATALMFDGSPISSFSLHGVEEDGIIAREVHWGSFGSASAVASLPLWGPKLPLDVAETRKIAVEKSRETITEKQRDIALKTTGYALDRERALTPARAEAGSARVRGRGRNRGFSGRDRAVFR